MTDTIAGFTRRRIPVNGITLSVQEAGQGAPLILLHGYPQNGLCWSRVAPAFAAQNRVIIPDLRGYGQSDAPPDNAAHTAYSKRCMAQDIVALMDQLGLERAALLGHDRGARVTYRLALDHPGRASSKSRRHRITGRPGRPRWGLPPITGPSLRSPPRCPNA